MYRFISSGFVNLSNEMTAHALRGCWPFRKNWDQLHRSAAYKEAYLLSSEIPGSVDWSGILVPGVHDTRRR